MSKNKYERRGRELRQQGKPKPPPKKEGFLTTKSEVRNRNDERIGYTKEDEARSRKARK